MKKILKVSIFLLIAQLSYSQTCENSSPYKEGMSLEYTNFNKKGKVSSIENHTIKSVTNEDGNLTITINSIVGKDQKSAKDYVLKCIGGGFYIDMANYTSLQNDDQKKSFQFKATGDFIEFPNEMTLGSVLEDGNIDLEIGNQEAFGSVASMKIFNRKILASDSLTTKAGTFDGYKVSFDYIFDLGLLKFRGSGIEWYVKGIGIVKTENYSKKGKLRSSRELTKMSTN